MSKSNIVLLRHILDELDFLIRESQKTTLEKFITDETNKRAFVRSVEIIGEASKKLPDNFRQDYPEVEWQKMMGMRDRLIHAYFGVDYAIVWDVATEKAPKLKQLIQIIIESKEQIS